MLAVRPAPDSADIGISARAGSAVTVAPARYTDAVEDSPPDPGIQRAGAAVAARRAELGISQRELARRKILTAPALIAFEKGRAWPRERTRHALEELLQWPAGTIARIRAGASAPQVSPAAADNGDTSLVIDALELALARFDTAIDALPTCTDLAFPKQAEVIAADLRKLEAITVRAVRHSRGSPAAIKALGTVRRRYDEVMMLAAAVPTATLGQRLYAARRRANVSATEAAAALGAAAELVDAVEAGEPVDGASEDQIEALIAALGEG